MQKEVWKDIKNFIGVYQVSNLGNVKSLNYNRTGKSKPLVQCTGGKRYLQVCLSKKGKNYNYNVHSLVALMFLNHEAKGSQKIVIDHIDNNPLNNRIENLQLVSNRVNTSKNRIGGTSKYLGVHWAKTQNKWVSQIHVNGERIRLGCFDCEIEAHKAYQNKLSELEIK